MKGLVVSEKALTLKYVIALSIVAILSAASFFIMLYMIDSQETNALVMNVSGRQRMLTQRTARLSLELAQSSPSSRKRIRSKLYENIDLLESSHFALINGDTKSGLPSTMSSALKDIYFERPDLASDKILRLVRVGNRFAGTPDSELSMDNPDLKAILGLVTGLREPLNSLVDQLQKESEAAIVALETVAAAIFALTLIVLLLIAFLIFKPTTRLIAEERRKLRAANAQLELLSMVDALTGIANRRRLEEVLDHEWQRSRREKTPLSLVLADLDFFKSYNDAYGHQAGDSCLQRVAHTMSATLRRPGDFLARYGGEEFMLILPNTDVRGALNIAEKIRQKIELLNIAHKKYEYGKLTLSLGVACARKNSFGEKVAFVRAADSALYTAKQSGRNCVRAYDSTGDQSPAS